MVPRSSCMVTRYLPRWSATRGLLVPRRQPDMAVSAVCRHRVCMSGGLSHGADGCQATGLPEEPGARRRRRHSGCAPPRQCHGYTVGMPRASASTTTSRTTPIGSHPSRSGIPIGEAQLPSGADAAPVRRDPTATSARTRGVSRSISSRRRFAATQISKRRKGTDQGQLVLPRAHRPQARRAAGRLPRRCDRRWIVPVLQRRFGGPYGARHDRRPAASADQPAPARRIARPLLVARSSAVELQPRRTESAQRDTGHPPARGDHIGAPMPNGVDQPARLARQQVAKPFVDPVTRARCVHGCS